MNDPVSEPASMPSSQAILATGYELASDNAGERLSRVESVINAIEDEHSARADNSKYCTEGSCHECDVIERINLALAGSAPTSGAIAGLTPNPDFSADVADDEVPREC